MNRTDIFFALLRAGLWEQDLRLEGGAPSADDWQAILQTAREQAVLGLVYRGMKHLPADQLPPSALRLRLLADADRIERRGSEVAQVREALFARLTAAGLHPLEQKGAEAGKYYALPQWRGSGDIDVFLPEGEFARALSLWPEGRTAPDGSRVFKLDGVTVELHRRYFDLHRHPDSLPEPPSVCAELLMLSAHILKHAIGEGVGCKQLCDMTRALDRTEGLYDKAELREWLRRTGLHRWHRLLCSLLVSDFGLDPARCLEGFTPVDAEPLRRIVLSGGAFGLAGSARRKAVRQGGAARKLQAAGAFLRRLPFSLRIAPRETLATIWELVRGNLNK